MDPDECEHWGMKAAAGPSVRPSSDGMVEYGAFIPVLSWHSHPGENNGCGLYPNRQQGTAFLTFVCASFYIEEMELIVLCCCLP